VRLDDSRPEVVQQSEEGGYLQLASVDHSITRATERWAIE